MAGFSQTVNTLTDESSHVSVHIREVHEQSSRESNISASTQDFAPRTSAGSVVMVRLNTGLFTHREVL